MNIHCILIIKLATIRWTIQRRQRATVFLLFVLCKFGVLGFESEFAARCVLRMCESTWFVDVFRWLAHSNENVHIKMKCEKETKSECLFVFEHKAFAPC